ncbi:MAG: thiamine pyrophosphate-binding protein [Nocardioides marinisabuli]|uniref:thiamine pyrophosphate-binding protein n=1 Tax=Nocardioides marinisabuli TaxID=419476 RepID=UPI003219473A
MTTVAELIIESVAEHGTTEVWGVVGDALNPVTDAIRREDRLRWMGVRHEEVAAFAAGAQAQLTGRLGVCMGTVGPGAIHLLNGLYDAKKSHAPVLAICGQVPRPEIGSDFFQEVDNDVLFADVAVFTATVTDPAQLPTLLEQAGNAALQQRGVAVLTIPGDVGELEVAKGTSAPRFVADLPAAAPVPEAVRAAAGAIEAADHVTLLVGQGPGAPATRCSSWPTGSGRRWWWRSRARRASTTTTPTRSASRGCWATPRPRWRSRPATCC